MLLDKILMNKATRKVGSVEYQISKKLLQLGVHIKDYKLTDFIKETGVSKMSVMRYMEMLHITSFSTLKEHLVSESLDVIHVLESTKKHYINTNFDKHVIKIAKMMKTARRVFVVGDINRYGIMGYTKALMQLGIDIDVPVFFQNEEVFSEEYQVTDQDLMIFINIDESYEHIVYQRLMIYQDPKFYDISCPTKSVFIGQYEKNLESKFDFIYNIDVQCYPQYSKLMQLNQLFENCVCYLAKNHEFKE